MNARSQQESFARAQARYDAMEPPDIAPREDDDDMTHSLTSHIGADETYREVKCVYDVTDDHHAEITGVIDLTFERMCREYSVQAVRQNMIGLLTDADMERLQIECELAILEAKLACLAAQREESADAMRGV